MSTLIIPCGGKSTRFPGVPPKWLLTHPDGRLMVESVIDGITKRNSFDRIIITCLLEHLELYEADLWIRSCVPSAELCVLPEPTKSAAETVAETILQCKVKGPIVIKDCDSYVEAKLFLGDFVVAVDVENIQDLRYPGAKSYVKSNEHGIIHQIVEKQVVSDHISVGVYGFSDAVKFVQCFNEISGAFNEEIYISYITQKFIDTEVVVLLIEGNEFRDWGTFEQWVAERDLYATYFCNLDGVILKNKGKFGSKSLTGEDEPIMENVRVLLEKNTSGSKIIFYTSRSNKGRKSTIKTLERLGFKNFELLCGCNEAKMVVINDFKAMKPFPSIQSISIPTNQPNLKDYIV